MQILINLLFFQGVWFLAILGGATGNQWLGPSGLMLFLISHYFLAPTAKADYLLVAMATMIGVLVETTFFRTDLIVYAHSSPANEFAPAWIVVLWANFALTMNSGLKWLQGHLLLASLLGAIGGPLTYFAGIKLGAATAGTSMPFLLVIIAVTYALITPLFLETARRLPAALERARNFQQSRRT